MSIVKVAVALVLTVITGTWCYLVVMYVTPLASSISSWLKWAVLASAVVPYALAVHYAALVFADGLGSLATLALFLAVTVVAPLVAAFALEKMLEVKRKRAAGRGQGEVEQAC